MRAITRWVLAAATLAVGVSVAQAANSKAASEAASPQNRNEEEVNKRDVVAFYEAALNRKDFDAARPYLGATYKQHNPNAADGVDGFKTFIAALKAKTPESHSQIEQVFVDGNYVILHVHKTSSPQDRGVAIVDIFRLDHGKIVEHWDVTQPIPEKTVSGNSMF